MEVKCSFLSCGRKIDKADERIEVKTVFQKSRRNFLVNWKKNGEATFHRKCWDDILTLKAPRARSKKIPDIIMSKEEKVLVREAAKTAERFDSIEKIKSEAKRVADLIKSSKHCVTFTGAGISTSAGIGDYRGKAGKWTQMDQEKLKCDSDEEEPQSKKQKICEDDDDDDEEEEAEDGVPYETLRPTYTHESLAKMMSLGHLKYVISQNGDGLHGLSGIPNDGMSELHGNVFMEKCEKCCTLYDRPYYVMDDVGSQYYEELEDFGETDIIKPKFASKCDRCSLSHRTGRRCNKKGCNGHLMDTIINFGDRLEDKIMDRAWDNVYKCDLMLCLGSTLKVAPANVLVEFIPRPQRLVICNRQRTHLDSICLSKDRDRRQLGSRVFGDCDIFFKEIMRNLLPSESLTEWENDRPKRMSEYDRKRKAP